MIIFQDLILSALYFSPYIFPFHSKFRIHFSGQLHILDLKDLFIPGPMNIFNVFSSLVISVYLVNVFNAPTMCKRLHQPWEMPKSINKKFYLLMRCLWSKRGRKASGPTHANECLEVIQVLRRHFIPSIYFQFLFPDSVLILIIISLL